MFRKIALVTQLRQNGRWRCALATLIVCCLIAFAIAKPLTCESAEPTAEQLEFFESRIRPVLIDQCYECHNTAKSAEGGFAVDQRSSFLKGGDNGSVIVPGKPAESRLLPILRHEIDGVKMPQGG